jgi:rhodanese-related sulfurtransferase
MVVEPTMYDLQTLMGFDLIIDARSPREFKEDHVPGTAARQTSRLMSLTRCPRAHLTRAKAPARKA